jgi:hypothetical protein
VECVKVHRAAEEVRALIAAIGERDRDVRVKCRLAIEVDKDLRRIVFPVVAERVWLENLREGNG